VLLVLYLERIVPQLPIHKAKQSKAKDPLTSEALGQSGIRSDKQQTTNDRKRNKQGQQEITNYNMYRTMAPNTEVLGNHHHHQFPGGDADADAAAMDPSISGITLSHLNNEVGASGMAKKTTSQQQQQSSAKVRRGSLGRGSGHGNRASEDPDDADRVIVEKPGPHDVLLGRGGGTNNHAGNIRFRKLVNEHKLRYLSSNKVEKPNVARDVVEIWRNLQPPGRFLARCNEKKKDGKKDSPENGNEDAWFEVGDKRAREKASQCLRERTPEVLPYIKKIREQQDAMTEEGMAIFQANLARQSGNGDDPSESHHDPSESEHNNESFVAEDFGQMTAAPDVTASSMRDPRRLPHAAGLYSNRRSSDGGLVGSTANMTAGGAGALGPHHPAYYSRRGSLPAAPASGPGGMPYPHHNPYGVQPGHRPHAPLPGESIEDSLYTNAAELDYYQRCNNLLAIQQQQIEEQMREYRMLQEQQGRYAAAGVSPRIAMRQKIDPSAVAPFDDGEDLDDDRHQLDGSRRSRGSRGSRGRGVSRMMSTDSTDFFSPLPLDHEAARYSGSSNAPAPATKSALKKTSGIAGSSKRSRDSPADPANDSGATPDADTASNNQRVAGSTTVTEDDVTPETTMSGGQRVAARASSSEAAGVDGEGEMTIEEYRRQLEEYMSKQQGMDGGVDAGNDSDLEDDWEKEKEKAYRHNRLHDSKKRGVNRNISGASFMSTDTFKSNLSMLSGMSLLSSDCSREQRMNMARSVSSNLSLMSELTDMSQNLEELKL